MIVSKISEIIKYLDCENDEYSCIWLVGDSVDIDVIWSLSQFEYVSEISAIENCLLFNTNNCANNWKCVFKKEFAQFLKISNRSNWSHKLLIKSTEAIIFDGDLVLKFEETKNLRKNLSIELIQWFCNKYAQDIPYDFRAQLPKYAKNLHDVLIINMLCLAKIDEHDWTQFLDENAQNWYGKFKENTLLQEAVLGAEEAIPVLQYLLRANSNKQNKAVAQFLLANIRNSGMIWDQDMLWKELM